MSANWRSLVALSLVMCVSLGLGIEPTASTSERERGTAGWGSDFTLAS